MVHRILKTPWIETLLNSHFIESLDTASGSVSGEKLVLTSCTMKNWSPPIVIGGTVPSISRVYKEELGYRAGKSEPFNRDFPNLELCIRVRAVQLYNRADFSGFLAKLGIRVISVLRENT